MSHERFKNQRFAPYYTTWPILQAIEELVGEFPDDSNPVGWSAADSAFQKVHEDATPDKICCRAWEIAEENGVVDMFWSGVTCERPQEMPGTPSAAVVSEPAEVVTVSKPPRPNLRLLVEEAERAIAKTKK